MKMMKLTLATAAALAAASVPSIAFANINVDHDTTSLGGSSFTDTFVVTGIDKGPFTANVAETTLAPGKFDVQVILNESIHGITSLTAMLNNQPITFVNKGGSNWYGDVSQTLSTAGTQMITLMGNSNANGKIITGTVTFAAATPEPAAWVLMIAGLGIVGGVMRRKRDAMADTFGNSNLSLA